MGMKNFFNKFKHNKNQEPIETVENVYIDEELSTNDESTMSEQNTTVTKFVPSSYNDLQNAVDALKQDKHIVISFEEMNDADFKRSVNFLSGVVYALDGSINKLGPKLMEFIVRK